MDFHGHDHDAHYVEPPSTTGVDFELTEEQRLLKEALERLAKEEFYPLGLEVDEKHVFPRRQLESLANLGVAGLVVPHLYGGLTGLGGMGSTTVAFVLVVAETARACPTTALAFVGHTVGTIAVVNGGDVGLRASRLPDLARGDLIATWATHGDVFARETNEGFELNGSASRVPACGQADVYLVEAKDGASAPLCCLVDKSMEG